MGGKRKMNGIDPHTAQGQRILAQLANQHYSTQGNLAAVLGQAIPIRLERGETAYDALHRLQMLGGAFANAHPRCPICKDSGEVPYENWSDTPSENKRPCAACTLE